MRSLKRSYDAVGPLASVSFRYASGVGRRISRILEDGDRTILEQFYLIVVLVYGILAGIRTHFGVHA